MLGKPINDSDDDQRISLDWVLPGGGSAQIGALKIPLGIVIFLLVLIFVVVPIAEAVIKKLPDLGNRPVETRKSKKQLDETAEDPAPALTPEQARSTLSEFSELRIRVKSPSNRTPLGFRVPPTVETFATSDEGFGNEESGDDPCDVDLTVRVERVDERGPVFGSGFELDRTSVQCGPRQRGRTLRISIETAEAICGGFWDNPYGRYRVVFKMNDRVGPGADVSDEFVYVFYTDFRDFGSVLDFGKFADHFSYRERGSGLRVRNNTQTGGYVPVTVVQPFDFRANMSIRGAFITQPDDPRAPTGLDVAICDASAGSADPGERVAVIMADGNANEVSIKINNDKRTPLTTRQIAHPDEHLVLDGHTRNHFLIRVYACGDGWSKCELYVQHYEVDPSTDRPVHERRFLTRRLGYGTSIIKLKFWQAGTVELLYLEIAPQRAIECR